MKTGQVLLILAATAVSAVWSQDGHDNHHLAWLYECQTISDKPRCVQVLATETTTGMSLNKCKITCGLDGVLWPKPSTPPQIGSEVKFFHTEDMQHSLTCEGTVCELLSSAVRIFKENLEMNYPEYDRVTKTVPKKSRDNKALTQVIMSIEVTGSETKLDLGTDESYTLTVDNVEDEIIVMIQAPTFFGARNGLETLSQVINYDHEMATLQIVEDVDVTDAPSFTYRGVLIDTSRNFYPIPDLKRIIDGMAASKLNSFHWHITDTASFPLEVPIYPNITVYGAYSDEEVYTVAEIQDFVEYATVRGIRVIPEIDAPAHFGNGFQWGPKEGLGELTVCTNRSPWNLYCVEPPCGQINIANPEIYNVLGNIYQTIVEAFGDLDVFHYGGDEVNYNCWNTTDEIVDWMTANGYGVSPKSYTEQWAVFQAEALKRFNAENGKSVPGIIWTSTLTEANENVEYFSPDDYIVQIWTTGTDQQIQKLLSNGFRVIFSNYDELYLDCGFGGWVNDGGSWCDPFKNWKTVYNNDPVGMAGTYLSQALGSEATIWSETIDEQNVDSRLWPRAAALAERLWSNPSDDWRDAEYRIVHHRQRLVLRGIRADRLQPEWCHENEYLCSI